MSLSGIGGQGKSALAAKYLSVCEEEYEFWDWRDCREEGDKLHTQLMATIQTLRGGSADATLLSALDTKSLVDELFSTIGQKRCLFVFDNIDHYIDLDVFYPLAGMKYLFDRALALPHKSKFVFTCRPTLRSDNPSFLSLPLVAGLSDEEAVELFRKREVKNPLVASVFRVNRVTNGHPLWLNLIAVQVARGKDLNTLLSSIEKGQGDLPTNTLRSIWESLNSHQQTVLRTMAELPRPETEENIGDIVERTINWNKFSKALRALKSLNLIIIKSRHGSTDRLELHPLIREFIKSEFPAKERERYISIIVSFFDVVIGRLKEHLSKLPSLDILENWVAKAELEFNRGNAKEALSIIEEISTPLLSNGYPEEFVRIARRVIGGVEWGVACVEYPDFNDVLGTFIEVIERFGEKNEVDSSLDKYRSAIPGKGTQYIHYCELMCYTRWFRGDFDEAIYWGKTGVELKNSSGVDTHYSCKHNLALSQRDGGNVEEALSYFLKGAALEDVIEKDADVKRGGEYYGNIGRCLFLKNDIPGAIACYRKSLNLIDAGCNSGRLLNMGYAAYWIAEALEATEDDSGAYYFYQWARRLWNNITPPRVAVIQKAIDRLRERNNFPETTDGDAWKVEAFCRRWLEAGCKDEKVADELAPLTDAQVGA